MKKIILVLLMSFAFIACSSYKNSVSLNSNLRKIELNMSKDEVVSILGKTYKSVGAKKTDTGLLETISYPDQYSVWFSFQFLNGRLVEWYQEKPVYKEHNHDHQEKSDIAK